MLGSEELCDVSGLRLEREQSTAAAPVSSPVQRANASEMFQSEVASPPATGLR